MKATVNTWMLNLRGRPSLQGRIVRSLGQGTTVVLLGIKRFSSGLDWDAVLLPDTDEIGWVASQFLKIEESTPVVVPRSWNWKIGWHIAGGNVPSNLLEQVRRLKLNNKPLPFVLIVNHGWLCRAIKEISPETVVVFRPVYWGDDDNPATRGWPSGEWWFQRLWEFIRPYREWFDYAQLENEWYVIPSVSTEGMRPFNKFNIELMEAANLRNIKLLVGNIAVGNLEPHHEPALDGMFRFAAEHGHAFDYHMYGSQEVNHSMLDRADLYAARWHRWARKYPRLKFAFGEMGSFHGPRFVNYQTTIRQMREAEQLIEPFRNQVVGGAWWTLAGEPGGWGADDFGSILENVVNFMLQQ